MFNSVLIAEDHQIANHSLQKSIRELGITDVDYAYYCDHALAFIYKRIATGQPYDLLITDLSFEADGHPQQLTDGEALIVAALAAQPNLKILVFSAEQRPAIIHGLYQKLNIDGYVRKARRDAEQLILAIEAISKNKRYYSPGFLDGKRQPNAHAFSTYDTTIILQLAKGTLQKEIPAYLRQNQIQPAGLSSVEKRLNQIKEALGFTKNEQLIAYCKDYKII